MSEKEIRITKLETQKRNKNRISIYIDNKYALGVHKDIVYKLNLEKGKILDKDFIEKIVKAEEQKKANEYAIKFLSYRPRSEKEIKDRMTKKEYEDEVINNTLEWLKKYDLVNDRDFVEEYVKSKASKYGRSRIRLELRRKGLDDNIVDDVLNSEYEHEKEYEIALEQAKRKIKVYKGESPQAIYRKLGGYLQRRGFSYDIVLKILKEII
ncbi:RecX family transcriptional regulator [Maledivibacter halophilus]|uniref:Regulatory protein RecX n=1 Tax=Maledivibacter halophilus TaxID=36842 RepID=A0A1T5IH55_9FIRM|nr:RecX family transcriptional regulator [Maledivibacter halophilus]SKC38477.1 regulatory protein [Maledivibacter halophilus]